MTKPWALIISSNSADVVAPSRFWISPIRSDISASSTVSFSRSACWIWSRFSMMLARIRSRSFARSSPSDGRGSLFS